ncbi:ankyrin repeat-containing domain protein [Baffinella frigidus]|nr:ankyrin repeat-containing domain protein [Cryptophyta sp. CCMP2293]
MERHEGRSVEEFNDDSEYSKMLQEAVQVKVLVARKADALIEAGGEGGRRMMLRGLPLDAFSTVYSFWAALAGYEGSKWERLKTKADEDAVLSLRDENGGTVLHWAVADDSRATLAEVIATRDAGRVVDVKNRDGNTPLHVVAQEGHEALAVALVAAGADKDAKTDDGDTPLHWAAANGHLAVARALVAAGADKDAQNTYGDTPLHLAVSQGLESLALALVGAGTNTEAKNEHGDTPLNLAAGKGIESLALALLAAGGGKDAKDSAGETPLHNAAWKGHEAVVRALRAAGADKEAKNKRGDTPLCLARLRHRGRTALVALLS